VVQSRVGEDDALGTCIIVLSPEDNAERYARMRPDRVRPVTAMDGDLDGMVATWIGPRSDRPLQDGYLEPRTRWTRFSEWVATGRGGRGSIS
jgi:hypothetical protein